MLYIKREDMEDDMNYVFHHVDPVTGNIRYIGFGKGFKAFSKRARRGHRKYLNNKIARFGVDHVVKVVACYDKWDDAANRKAEELLAYQLVHDKLPHFNKIGGRSGRRTGEQGPHRKVTEEEWEEWMDKRADDWTYAAIARDAGRHYLTVWQKFNGCVEVQP